MFKNETFNRGCKFPNLCGGVPGTYCWHDCKNIDLPDSFIVEDDLSATRFEREIKKLYGKDNGYSAALWQMSGLEKVHLFAIKYGKTEEEAKENLRQYLLETGIGQAFYKSK